MKLTENWSICDQLGVVSIYSNNRHGSALKYVVTTPKENVEMSNRHYYSLGKAKECRDDELLARVKRERKLEIPKVSKTGLSKRQITSLFARVKSRV